MLLPDGSEVQLQDNEEIKDFGIEIESRNMTSTLKVSSDDETLYDHRFELQIKNTVTEEPDWFNTTLIKVNFVKPPCEVSQD